MPTPTVRAELVEAGVVTIGPFDKLRANGGSPIMLGLSKDKLRANGYLFAMCVPQKFPKNQSFARPNKVFTDPACCAARMPRERARRASSSSPITVAERGFATMS